VAAQPARYPRPGVPRLARGVCCSGGTGEVPGGSCSSSSLCALAPPQHHVPRAPSVISFVAGGLCPTVLVKKKTTTTAGVVILFSDFDLGQRAH
jgi:hypothetical protein